MNNAVHYSLCCCGCGFDTTLVNHFCSVSGFKARSFCLSKGAPEEFGSSWPCSRCANINFIDETAVEAQMNGII